MATLKLKIGQYNELTIEGQNLPQFWQEKQNGSYTTDCGESNFTEINHDTNTISEINNGKVVKSIHFDKLQYEYSE